MVMSQHRPFLSVLRIASLLILVIALHHFLVDWEWLPGEGGWGIGRLMVLFLWAVVCVLLDLILRRIIADQLRLNIIEAATLVFGVAIMVFSA
jgi:hypothetical protein